MSNTSSNIQLADDSYYVILTISSSPTPPPPQHQNKYLQVINLYYKTDNTIVYLYYWYNNILHAYFWAVFEVFLSIFQQFKGKSLLVYLFNDFLSCYKPCIKHLVYLNHVFEAEAFL
jgi:hypothetical protein